MSLWEPEKKSMNKIKAPSRSVNTEKALRAEDLPPLREFRPRTRSTRATFKVAEPVRKLLKARKPEFMGKRLLEPTEKERARGEQTRDTSSYVCEYDLEFARRFLDALAGPEAKIHWTFLDDGKRGLPPIQEYRTFADVLPDLVRRNLDGYGVFYALHETPTGKRSNASIGRVRAFAADFDDALPLLENIPLEPSAVFRTSSRGVHFIWFLDGDCTHEQFTGMQKTIAGVLGSDPKISDPARILRLPGTLHWKREPAEHAMPVMLEIGNRYSLEQVSEAFAARQQLHGGGKRGGSSSTTVAGRSMGEIPTPSSAEVDAVPLKSRMQWCADHLAGEHDVRGHDFFKVACLGHDYGVPALHFLQMVEFWAKDRLRHRRTDTRFTRDELSHYVGEAYDHAKLPWGWRSVEKHDLNEWVASMVRPTPEELAEREADRERAQRRWSETAKALSNQDRLLSRAPGETAKALFNQDHLLSLALNPALDFDTEAESACPPLAQRPRVVFCRAPMGKGKTRFMVDRTRGRSMLAVTALVSLVHNLAERYGDCAVYSDEDGPDAERVATTLKSIGRIAVRERDCVVIDEISTVLAFLVDSGMCLHPASDLAVLVQAVCMARETWIADADLTDDQIALCMGLIAEARPDTEFVLLDQAPDPEKPQRAVQRYSLSKGRAELYRLVDDWKAGDAPLVVPTTSRKEVDTLVRAIHKRRPDLSVRGVNSDNAKEPEVQEALKDPDTLLEGVDVFVYSPSVATGVSFQRPAAKVFVVQSYDEVPAATVCQMAMRFRNVLDPVVGWASPRWTADDRAPTDPPTIRRQALGYADATDKVVRDAAVEFRFDGIDRRPTNEEFMAVYVEVQIRKNRQKNDPWGVTTQAIRRHGWLVYDDSDREPTGAELGRLKAWKRERQAATKASDAEYSAGVMGATSVSVECLDRLQAQPVLTVDERYAIVRTQIEAFYGRAPDQELIERDDRGKWRGRVAQYIEVWAYQDPEMRGVLSMREANATRGKSAAEYKNRLLRTILLSDLLHEFRAVVGGGGLFDTVTADRGALETFAWDYYQRHAKDFQGLFRSKLSDRDKAVQWLNRMLARTGVLTDAHKKGNAERGEERRHYTYDWSQAEADGEHLRRVLVSDTVLMRAQALDLSCLLAA